MDEDVDQERNKQITLWHSVFKEGTDFDLWGQPVEAIENYRRLAAHARLQGSAQAIMFSDDQKKILNKIAACLELRCKALQTPSRIEGVSLDDLKKIETSLRNLLSVNSREFPLDVSGAYVQGSLRSPSLVEPGLEGEDGVSQTSSSKYSSNDREEDDEYIDERLRGNLLPAPEPIHGQTLLTIRIEKIGLKDATQYIDSFITTSVKDVNGVDVTCAQDTPVANLKEENCIHFGVAVHIQRPLELLPLGFAVYFEFKHYKPKKKMNSTKCWAFMEKDEIKEGPAVIELYKKPTDLRKKKKVPTATLR